MRFDSHQIAGLPIGTRVTGADGRPLGRVHEVYAHFVIVRDDDEPSSDLEVPAHAILGLADGILRVSITRASANPVDDGSTVHAREHD